MDDAIHISPDDIEIVNASEYSEDLTEYFNDMPEVARPLLKGAKEVFSKIEEDALYNSQRVLSAFQKNNVSEMHFGATTGYGQGDVRERLYRKNICRGFRSRGCTCT